MSRWPNLISVLLAFPGVAWADDDGFEAIAAAPVLGFVLAALALGVIAPMLFVALHPASRAPSPEPSPARPEPRSYPEEAASEGSLTLDSSIRRPW